MGCRILDGFLCFVIPPPWSLEGGITVSIARRYEQLGVAQESPDHYSRRKNRWPTTLRPTFDSHKTMPVQVTMFRTKKSRLLWRTAVQNVSADSTAIWNSLTAFHQGSVRLHCFTLLPCHLNAVLERRDAGEQRMEVTAFNGESRYIRDSSNSGPAGRVG